MPKINLPPIADALGPRTPQFARSPRKAMASAIIFGILVAASPASSGTIGAGSPDPTFGTDGRSESIVNAAGLATVVQPDGRIMAFAREPSGGYYLIRYNGDGSIDKTFGGEGKTWTGRPVTSAGRVPPVLVNQIDDGTIKTIVRVGGTLVRYDGAGIPDQTFGTNGKLPISQDHPFGPPRDVEVVSTGSRIIVLTDGVEWGVYTPVGHATGHAPYPQAVLAFTADGAPDPTFGKDGVLPLGMPFLRETQLKDAVIQPDGKILLTGGSVTIRLLTDGTLDYSFGDRGVARDPSVDEKTNQYITTVADGRALVLNCGLRASGFAELNDACELVRYSTEGKIDDGYGAAGRAQLPGFAMESLVIDSRSRAVIFGVRWEATDAKAEVVTMRLLPDGAADLQFGSEGIVRSPSDYYYTIPGTRGDVQSDDKVVRPVTVREYVPSLGHESTLQYLWRYLGDPQETATTTTEGWLRGTVVDGRSRVGLAGALVDCGAGRSVTTDAAGAYSMRLPVGTHTCTASAPNYRSSAARVNVTDLGAIQDFKLR